MFCSAFAVVDHQWEALICSFIVTTFYLASLKKTCDL